MAVYRVSLDLFFDSLTDVQAFKDQIITILPQVRNVIGEDSKVTVHVCHHDEIPPGPCNEIVYQWKKQ